MKVYFTRLWLALLGRPFDQPVRHAQYLELCELMDVFPLHIPNSTKRTSVENLRWMVNRLLTEMDTFPVDKTGRWIGFIHGVFALSQIIDVDTTRDRSRERFHAAYKATGQVIPETKNM